MHIVWNPVVMQVLAVPAPRRVCSALARPRAAPPPGCLSPGYWPWRSTPWPVHTDRQTDKESIAAVQHLTHTHTCSTVRLNTHICTYTHNIHIYSVLQTELLDISYIIRSIAHPELACYIQDSWAAHISNMTRECTAQLNRVPCMYIFCHTWTDS